MVSTGRTIAESVKSDAEATGTVINALVTADLGTAARVVGAVAQADVRAAASIVAETARADAASSGRLVAESARLDAQSIGEAIAAASVEDHGAIGEAVAESAKADSEATGKLLVRSANVNATSTDQIIGESAKRDSFAVGQAVSASAREAEATDSLTDLANAIATAAVTEAAEVTAAMSVPAADPVALAILGTELPVEVWVPEESPEPGPDPLGDGEWASVGSPAPLDRILAKFDQSRPAAHVAVNLLDGLPVGMPDLSAGRTAHTFMTLAPENFDDVDMSAAHATLFVEKSWLSANAIHQWSIEFSRFDEERGTWTPSAAKRIREDQERVYYSVVIPGFSTWALSGSAEPPSVRFRVDDLVISPPIVQEGETVIIRSQVTNLMEQSSDFTASLWLNSRLHSTLALTVEAKSTVPISFRVTPKAGSYSVRINRQLSDLVVEPAGSPIRTVEGLAPTVTDVDAGRVTAALALAYLAGLIVVSTAITLLIPRLFTRR